MESFINNPGFSGTLPKGIEKISVSVNGETLPLSRSDFSYSPGRRLFWASLPGEPKSGDYTITVTGQNNTGITTDRLATLISIDPPKPDNASPNSTMPCTTNRALFAWRAAKADVPLYYRLEIAPAGGRTLYRSNDVRDMLSVGELVFEEYFYGHGRDRKHLIASVTKSVYRCLWESLSTWISSRVSKRR